MTRRRTERPTDDEDQLANRKNDMENDIDETVEPIKATVLTERAIRASA
jgi:hypothetical protein